MDFWDKRSKWEIFFLSTIIIIFIGIFYNIPAVILYLLTGTYTEYVLELTGISQILLLFLPTVFLVRKTTIHHKRDILPIKTKVSAEMIILSILLVVFVNMVSAGFDSIQFNLVPESLMQFYQQYTAEVSYQYFELLKKPDLLGLLVVLFAAAVAPAISEEVLFRGFYFAVLSKKIRVGNAIFISSFLFAIIHFNFYQLHSLVLIGVVLALLRYYTKSLFWPMLVHFINNAFACIIIHYSTFDEYFQAEPYFPFSLSMLIMILGILFLILTFKRLRSIFTEKDTLSEDLQIESEQD